MARYLLKPFYALRNRTFLLPVSCMHHCINTRQITIITAALCYQPSNRCSIPSIRPRLQTEGHKRKGGDRGFLETRTKSDTKTGGRVARGGRSQTSNTQSLLLREKISYWTRRGRLLSDEKMQRETAVLSKRQTALHNDYLKCPPGLLHKNWDLRN